MDSEKGGPAGKKTAAGNAGGHGEASARLGSSVGRQRKITPEERTAAKKFLWAALESAKQYNAMTEEDDEEEYRLAGKLHKYDPDTEWMKRVARVARIYPPPKFIATGFDEFERILEEDEQDFPVGLASCAGIFL